VVSYLNRKAGRRLRPTTYVEVTLRALQAGFNETDLRLVCWYFVRAWKDREEMCRWLVPEVLFRLKNPKGLSLAQRVDMAQDEWRRVKGSDPPPPETWTTPPATTEGASE
jgi:uncharacterized phage protein (TIGR02220 family)